MKAILQLASGLGIAATAEGVETEAQLDQLAAGGCIDAQGYLFSPPRPVGEVERILQDGRPVTLSDEDQSRDLTSDTSVSGNSSRDDRQNG